MQEKTGNDVPCNGKPYSYYTIILKSSPEFFTNTYWTSQNFTPPVPIQPQFHKTNTHYFNFKAAQNKITSPGGREKIGRTFHKQLSSKSVSEASKV